MTDAATRLTAFIAYPYNAKEVRETIGVTVHRAKQLRPSFVIKPWEATDVVGRCLVDPLLESINQASFIIADISKLNFNVAYEIGFAIGKQKRVILIRNRAIRADERLAMRTGIFDTIGQHEFSNSDDLAKYLIALEDQTPLPLRQIIPNRNAPVYIVAPRDKTEAEIRIFSRVKREARLLYRLFDPEEHSRMSVRTAIDNVSASLGVIVPLISSNRTDSEPHNLRCAFVAGLANGLERETLILQAGADPIPLDLRDAVSIYSAPSTIDPYIAAFAPRITERLQVADQREFIELQSPITSLFLGASAAENEWSDLGNYYIQTDEYRRLVRGEIQVVAGRKGSGKSALFFQVRDRLQGNRQNVVVGLNPEGFQLRKFKTVVLNELEEGTREHTVTAFWEYLLLLELCQKLLEDDRSRHLHDHRIRDVYQSLEEAYRNDPFVSEGDFAERLLRLTDAIADRFVELRGQFGEQAFLERQAVTELVYKHDLRALRARLGDYLALKEEVWVLFDNLDKGWNPHGVDDADLLNIRCLLDAFTKLRNDLERQQITFHGVLFVRNDVYELMVEAQPDRGKTAKAALDWSDPELLRELLRRRFVVNLNNRELDFDTIWRSVAATHLSDGQETSSYLIQRCLMRPRALIDLLGHCRSHAINPGHQKINESDVIQGERAYSIDLVRDVSLELQDVFPESGDALFAFIEAPSLLDAAQLRTRLGSTGIEEERWPEITDLLLWYGILGILRKDGDETYIYDVHYEMRKLKALIINRGDADLLYVVNRAFWRGLDIEHAGVN